MSASRSACYLEFSGLLCAHKKTLHVPRRPPVVEKPTGDQTLASRRRIYEERTNAEGKTHVRPVMARYYVHVRGWAQLVRNSLSCERSPSLNEPK